MQNLNLNIPVKRKNSDIDPAGQDFASQGSSLITSRRVTNWGSEDIQI